MIDRKCCICRHVCVLTNFRGRRESVSALIQLKGKVQTSSPRREAVHPLPRSLNRKWTKWVPSWLPDMTQKIWRSETTYLIRGFSMNHPSKVWNMTQIQAESSTTSHICLYCTECSNMYEFDHKTVISVSTVQTAHGFVQLTNTFAFMCSHLSGGEMLSEQKKKKTTPNWQECLEFCNMSYVYKLSSVAGELTSVRDALRN